MNAANWSIMKFNPEARAFVESEPQRELFRKLDRAREETVAMTDAELAESMAIRYRREKNRMAAILAYELATESRTFARKNKNPHDA